MSSKGTESPRLSTVNAQLIEVLEISLSLSVSFRINNDKELQPFLGSSHFIARVSSYTLSITVTFQHPLSRLLNRVLKQILANVDRILTNVT